jgi:hypothetical protein
MTSGREETAIRRGISARLRGATLAAAGLCLILTGCTVTTAGRPAAGPDLGHWQPPPIQAAQVDSLVLSPSEVNAIGGSTNMAVRRTISLLVSDDDTLTDKSCLDIYSPIEESVYRGNNWGVVTGQILNDAAAVGSARHAVIQALVGFRDAEAAQQFFGQAKQRWSACEGKSAVVMRPGRPVTAWVFRNVVTHDNTLTATQSPSFADGYTCQRAMGLRNNVIIDALWCGFDTTTQAGEVVAKIADAVSHT